MLLAQVSKGGSVMPIDLITGASGLLGGNLARALVARGRRVRILVRKNSKTSHLDDLGLERVPGDVTDSSSLPAAFEGVQNVYHCAALVSMSAWQSEQMWRVNVLGTQNVVRAARDAAVRRLVHCSSADAIGLSASQPSTEATPWNWDRLGLDNPYARTKYLAQRHVLQAAGAPFGQARPERSQRAHGTPFDRACPERSQRAHGKQVDAVVVNPTFMFGAYDVRPSSGQMILEVARGRVRGYPAGGNNFVDVQDVAEAMIAAATHGKCGEVYILGHENLSYREIFARIAKILHLSPPRLAIPYPVARLGGWWGDLVDWFTRAESSVNTTTARLGYVDHYYSSAKAVRELGMRQTPIEEAIERAVRWFYDVGMMPSAGHFQVPGTLGV
jgi:dihydroflavonol-4-reductase